MSVDDAPVRSKRDVSCRSASLVASTSKKYDIPNLRDMHDASDVLRRSRLYRASQVFDKEKLLRLGVNTVVDLRTPDMKCRTLYQKIRSFLRFPLRIVPENALVHEMRACPHRCPVCSLKRGTTVVHANLITGYIGMSIFWRMPKSTKIRLLSSFFERGGPSAMMARDVANREKFGFYALYVMILENSKRSVAKVMRIFLFEENFPVLIHCVHGKDRTGIIIALLLLLCGVERRIVQEDYVASEEELFSSKEANRLDFSEHLQQDVVMEAPLDVISDTIDYITREYGGAHEYLRSAGLTDAELSTIRINLKQKNDAKDLLETMQRIYTMEHPLTSARLK